MQEHTPKYISLDQGSSDRAFGLVFAVFFTVIGLFPLLRAQNMRLWALVIAATFFLLALIAPRILGRANRGWAKFGLLLHKLVSPVALGLLFFCVVTPTGLLLRALNRDPLRLRFEPSSKTYWLDRTPPGPEAESLKNQF
ncbi:SxtJ family membrane protein [Paucibacter sp. AS339]|uniref:SxtJ family membrane protein n=1 Tax=Paucibacter hankyongi TaxID=3133434 RepID=UPI0030952769